MLPTIGRSVLGEAEFRNLAKRLQPGQHAILIAARGRYSFKGSGYVRGGIFDRFQVIQRDISIRFHDRDHKRLRKVAADGAPDFDEVDLFVIDPEIEFDPTASWTLELLVNRETGPTRKAFVTFALDYRVPDRFVQVETPAPVPAATPQQLADAAEPPLWPTLWHHKRWEVVTLIAALTLLTAIFFFQNWFTRRPVLIERLRVGFLLFTLLGIGFYANAQLSVVNILTVFSALVSGFDWTYFLMEPLVFVLWGSVAVSLLFWGRGAFCGWLCPFGALQELVNRLARALHIRQLRVPWALHERLWPIKYILFLGLFGVSLHSLELAERLAEVEPFKTAIVLKFQRAWPYVTFAAVLVLASVFIERFYCRYLCALGAALAIPGRLRTFDWLKRYRQCGAPCQQCATGCMVQAIHPEGNINPNECLYCLHCQVLYFDDKRCPVMVQRRVKRERRESRISEGSKEELDRIVSELQRDRAARRAAENK